MANSVEFQDILLDAMKMVAEHTVRGLQYDKTELCTIIDASKASEGKYEVQNGTYKFTALSTDTSFRTNDKVYVTIPNGDYENEKIIVGKQLKDDNLSYVYISPTEKILDLTGDLFVENEPPEGYKIQANVSQGMADRSDLVDIENTTTTITTKPLATFSAEKIVGLSRIGLKASFSTKPTLAEAVQGEYGILIRIITEDDEKKEKVVKDLIFSSGDMFGNPYNFNGFYLQEQAFNIENLDIKSSDQVIVSLYQNNQFKDKSGNSFEYNADTNQFEEIYVKDIEIFAGQDINKYNSSSLEIYTSDNDDYDNTAEKRIKRVNARWIYVYNDVPHDMSKVEDFSEVGLSNEVTIVWYRYAIGADDYGANWEEYKTLPSWSGSIELDPSKQIDRFMAIVTAKAADGSTLTFKSNELVFTNSLELPNSATIATQTALQIKVKDGSNGNYFVYGQDGRIKIDESVKKRVLTLTFDSSLDGNGTRSDITQLEEGETITWTFPQNSTMLNLETEGNNNYPLEFYYSLRSFYSPKLQNNTVIATYTKDGITYRTEREFSFGYAGTQGTDVTLVIDFEGDQKYYNTTSSEDTKFKLRVYDASGIEVVLSSEEQGEIKWELTSSDDAMEKGMASNDTFSIEAGAFDVTKDLPILKATLNNLSTYFAIPLQEGSSYSYITGATQVIYRPDGLPEYDRSEYDVFPKKDFDDPALAPEITWRVVAKGSDGNLVEINNYENEKDDEILNYKKDNNYAARLEDNRLCPPDVFVDNAVKYGVQCLENSTVVWTQPILTIQNRWGSQIINEWDGKAIEMNGGTILANSIAAGQKESDNSFSGVMMGYWKDADGNNPAITESGTGIYGFQKGSMTYAFKEDGSAFLRDANGNGKIDFSGANGEIVFTNGDNNITISADSNKKPLTVGKAFLVDWDGNGSFSGNIAANSGYIGDSINGFTIGKLCRYIASTKISSGKYYFKVEGSNYGFTLMNEVPVDNQIILNVTDSTVIIPSVSGATQTVVEANILADNDLGEYTKLYESNTVDYSLFNKQFTLNPQIDSVLGSAGVYISPDGIGLGNGRFYVNNLGEAVLDGNITMSGSIKWSSLSNPCQVLYAEVMLEAPADGFSWASAPSSSTTGWHQNVTINDKYASYTYNGGEKWTTAVKIVGENGKDGENGKNAELPGYIKETYIDFSEIQSPSITGNIILGGEISGGSFCDADQVGRLTLSNDETYADMTFSRYENGGILFKICDAIDYVSLSLGGNTIGHSSADNKFYTEGYWNFGESTIVDFTNVKEIIGLNTQVDVLDELAKADLNLTPPGDYSGSSLSFNGETFSVNTSGFMTLGQIQLKSPCGSMTLGTSQISFIGPVNFTNATVTGLNAYYVFA